MDVFEHQHDQTVLTELGKRVAAHRIDHQLTQAMLAARACVSKRTVERLENGHSVQLIYLLRIVRALGLLDVLDQVIPAPVSSLAPSPRKRVRRKPA